MADLESCELIIADLMSFLQTVDGVAVVERGVHKIPDIDQYPAIVIADGEDQVTESNRRGNQRSWEIGFILLVQGIDADDEFAALRAFRQVFRLKMQAFRKRTATQWHGTIYETLRGEPTDPGQGNYVIGQALLYRAIYTEAPLA